MSAIQQMQHPEQVRRLVQQGCFLLKTFHEEYEKNKDSNETAFWQGELAGFRQTLDTAFQEKFTQMIVEDIRQQTGLKFPHINRQNLGVDWEAGH
jgi:hypothetical protein